jgi:aromatic-L-amino-acid/L-tryptophan decarboxylase
MQENNDAERRVSPRISPLDLSPDEFRALGHRLVDRIAAFLESLSARPVTRGESPANVIIVTLRLHRPAS